MATLSVEVFITLLCFAHVSIAVDLTLQEGAVGPFVVQATIAKLDNAFPNGDSQFWDITQSIFMRTLAYVESEDGTLSASGNQQQSRMGIWRVDINRLISTKNIIQSLDRGIIIRNEINMRGIADWESIFNRENMNIPLYSCMAARLFLLFTSDIRTSTTDECSPTLIPNLASSDIVIESAASYWYFCYRQEDFTISQDHFVTQYEQLLLRAENGIDCNVNTDLAFVLDSSGSIGFENWELVRQYVMNVVNLVGVSEGDRVAIIRYSTNSFVDISLDSNQNLLLSVIASMQHLDRGTNTAEALLELPDQPWRQNALRIAIVMTDGLSNDKNATLHAVKQVRRDIRMPSLITFVVGVADYDRTEVLAIASSNRTVSDLDSFNTEDLTDTLERQTHQICYSASSMVEVGDNNILKYGEFLQSTTVRLTYQLPEGDGLTIRLCVEDGQARLYGSFSIPNPNRAFYDFVLDAITHGQMCEDVYIVAPTADVTGGGRKRRQVAPVRMVFVAIEGVANNSTFSLESDSGNTVQYSVTCAQNPCGRNTICTNTTTGRYSCDCVPGFIFGPDATNCQDINECELLSLPCNPFASCSNTIGSVECTCLPGYSGNGFKCIIEQNTELRLIVSVVSSVAGGILLLLVVVAAIISIYLVLVTNKKSKVHKRDDRCLPANPNSGDSTTGLSSVDTLY